MSKLILIIPAFDSYSKGEFKAEMVGNNNTTYNFGVDIQVVYL
jgi:hypothetical protein